MGRGQHGLGHKALALFHSIKEELGTNPDSGAFISVLSACRHSGLVDEGLAVYNSMGAFAISPTPEHPCCVVDMLGRHGRVEEAYDLALGLGKDGNCVGGRASIIE